MALNFGVPSTYAGARSAHFHDDIVNAFQLSDAYETHNMGLRHEMEDYYVLIDSGIVSPGIYAYWNEYLEANRSFGELITL